MRTMEHKLVAYQIPVATDFAVTELVRLGADASAITVQVTVAGGTLDEFVLSGRVEAEGTEGGWVVLKNAAGTWATATTAMPFTSGNIAVLASSGTASGIFIHDVRGLDAIRFSISANTTVVTSVTILVQVHYDE